MSIYGCHNKPRPTEKHSYVTQNGWIDIARDRLGPAIRSPRYVDVHFAMSTECQYTKQHAADALCSGCVHRSKEKP